MVRDDLRVRLTIGFFAAVAQFALLTAGIHAIAGPPTGDARILPAESSVEELWNEGEFTEGVAVAPDGAIYFSDIPKGATPGQVLKFDPQTGETTVHCADSGKSNGLMFDRDGRLIAACGANAGRRGLCEITPDGEVRTLVDKFEGKPFNSPNDLVICPDGDIYFTDPRYVGAEPLELDQMSVYRYRPGIRQATRASTDIPKPNGVVCAPDGETLYVALNDNGKEQLDDSAEPARPVQLKLLACPRRADGTLGPS
ncbi:MAG: SMP-30/gluconolactonase/LRE family protein, partial [Planctomycetaceae bacterium]